MAYYVKKDKKKPVNMEVVGGFGLVGDLLPPQDGHLQGGDRHQNDAILPRLDAVAQELEDKRRIQEKVEWDRLTHARPVLKIYLYFLIHGIFDVEYLQCFPQWMASPPPIFLEKTAQHWTTKMSKFFQKIPDFGFRVSRLHTGVFQSTFLNCDFVERCKFHHMHFGGRDDDEPTKLAKFVSMASCRQCCQTEEFLDRCDEFFNSDWEEATTGAAPAGETIEQPFYNKSF